MQLMAVSHGHISAQDGSLERALIVRWRKRALTYKECIMKEPLAEIASIVCGLDRFSLWSEHVSKAAFGR